MENTTKELAEKALNDLLAAMSHYANERPHCTEEFASKSEYIKALSIAIAAVNPIVSYASITEALEVNCENKYLSASEATKELEHYRNAKFVTFDDLSEIFDFRKKRAPEEKADHAAEPQSQPNQDLSICELLGIDDKEEKRVRGAKL